MLVVDCCIKSILLRKKKVRSAMKMHPGMQPIKNPVGEALVACKSMIKYVLSFGIILNLLMMSTALYSLQVLDRVLSSGNLNTLLMLTIAILIAQILQGLLQSARAFAMNKVGSWFEMRLSETVFSNSIRAAIKSKNNANSQALRDLQTIKTYLTSPGLIAVMDTPWAIIFIIVLYILHPFIGTIAVLGGCILIFVGFIADRATKRMLEKNNENFIRSMRHVDQATRNAEVVEVMGMRGNIIKSWQKINQEVQTLQSLTNERQTTFMELIRFIRVILQISVTGCGALLVLKGEFSAGAIIASSTLVGRALAPFEVAINSWKGYINSRKSYERLEAAFAIGGQADEKMDLPEPEGYIEAENVYYAYPGSTKHLIKGASFKLEPGEMLAIIGPSGSGKSTMAKLLTGCYTPTIGHIRVDGASLSDWPTERLGQRFGYLPQDVELFGGTVKENIARMNPDAEPESVVIAAQLAGVHDLILHLPQAYDTQLGYDGSSLSGGQKQRVGLARSFYGEPKILVLDEPNANLDQAGEEALATALAVAKEQKITTIIISHKTQVLNLADKIMIMQDGMVAGFGPAKEILEKMTSSQQQSIKSSG